MTLPWKGNSKRSRHNNRRKQRNRNYVLSLGAKPGKIKVLHNGVDLAKFKPLPGKRQEIRRKLQIPHEAPVFLTVRRLVYKNGIDTLVDCAKSAIQRNPNVVFLVVGKGPDLNSVKETVEHLKIEKNFRLVGFVSDEELPFYYNAADAFVLPSKSGEGLPLVALEAMACALPVIATNVGGISEIMLKGFGKLVPPNQPEQLAEAVVEFAGTDLSSGKSEYRSMVEEKYSWDKNVDALVEIYEELI